jgi:hypothetical protein
MLDELLKAIEEEHESARCALDELKTEVWLNLESEGTYVPIIIHCLVSRY